MSHPHIVNDGDDTVEIDWTTDYLARMSQPPAIPVIQHTQAAGPPRASFLGPFSQGTYTYGFDSYGSFTTPEGNLWPPRIDSTLRTANLEQECEQPRYRMHADSRENNHPNHQQNDVLQAPPFDPKTITSSFGNSDLAMANVRVQVKNTILSSLLRRIPETLTYFQSQTSYPTQADFTTDFLAQIKARGFRLFPHHGFDCDDTAWMILAEGTCNDMVRRSAVWIEHMPRSLQHQQAPQSLYIPQGHFNQQQNLYQQPLQQPSHFQLPLEQQDYLNSSSQLPLATQAQNPQSWPIPENANTVFQQQQMPVPVLQNVSTAEFSQWADVLSVQISQEPQPQPTPEEQFHQPPYMMPSTGPQVQSSQNPPAHSPKSFSGHFDPPNIDFLDVSDLPDFSNLPGLKDVPNAIVTPKVPQQDPNQLASVETLKSITVTKDGWRLCTKVSTSQPDGHSKDVELTEVTREDAITTQGDLIDIVAIERLVLSRATKRDSDKFVGSQLEIIGDRPRPGNKRKASAPWYVELPKARRCLEAVEGQFPEVERFIEFVGKTLLSS